MHGQRSAPRRGRRVGARLDPVGPVTALVAACVYLLNGFDGYLSRDLALYAYAGQQLADGQAPYVGVVNRSGPLSHAVPGLGVLLGRALGIDELLAMRLFFMVLAAVCVWLAYVLGRDLLGNRWAGLATATALLAVHGFAEYATNGPREKTTLVLFLLAAFVAAVRLRPGWAGAFVSLATLTWQPSLFVGGVTVVVAVLALAPGGRARGLLSFAFGGLVPLGLCVAFYAAIGEWRTFWDCFLLIHVSYTEQPGLGTDFAGVREMLFDAYGVFFWSMLVGAGTTVLVALLGLLVPARRRDPGHWLVLALALGLGAGLLWCLKAFNGFPDIFFMLPATVVGVGLLIREVARWSDGAAVALAVTWSLVAVAGAVQYSVTTRDDTLDTQRSETEAAFAALPADASVVSIEGPHPLVLTSRTNPYPHQMFSLGLEDYVDDTWPGGLAGLAADIGARRPTVIAVGTLDPVWLRPVLDDGYVEVGTTTGWHWYVDESVGPDVLAAVGRATAGGEMDAE